MDRIGAFGLFVDVGSTFTKLVAVDDRCGELVATAQAPTTVGHDVMDGYRGAFDELPLSVRRGIDWAEMTSSAAGGLRIASVGLTGTLSGRAGRLAALGAGAKVVIECAGRLDEAGLEAIAAAGPHIVLLSGGVDGGDRDTLVANAEALTSLPELPSVIVAGNREAAPAAASVLRRAAPEVVVVDNVFPIPGTVQIEATRRAVVDLFTRRITRAKGLDGLSAHLRTSCEPTPLAVSRGAEVVAEVMAGPIVVVDLGGATTDIHSVGGSQPQHGGPQLPEPTTSRTVEGDIGMRWGAPGVLEVMGEQWCAEAGAHLACDMHAEAQRRSRTTELLAASPAEREIDMTLARAAVSIALQRHAGRVVVRQNAWGDRYRIEGKDLRGVRWLLSTGGIFRHLPDGDAVLRGALQDASHPMLPAEPALAFDDHYVLFAVGLAVRRGRSRARRLCTSLFGL
jgi:uncharacterized protein (TIGR01319 family)